MALSPVHIAILLPLVVALPAILVTIVVHAIALVAIVHFVRGQRRSGRVGAGFWTNLTIAAAIQIALTAHLLEIAIWALIFVACGEFTSFPSALYHSAVNYTSLGYGEVVMSTSWRLLGPIEATNGMLLFGVSTAMIFAVTQRLLEGRFADLKD